MSDKPTKPFIQVPEEIVLNKVVSSSALHLYIILLRYARQSGYCWPSQETLAKDIGRSIRQVRTLLNILEQRGLIVIDHRGESGESNHYYVLYSVGGPKFVEESNPEFFPELVRNDEDESNRGKNSLLSPELHFREG